MSSKTKKLIAMTVVLVIMIALYVFLNTSNDEKPVTEETISYNLFDTDISKVNSINWSINDNSYSFVKEAGYWYRTDDKQYPISNEKIQSLIESIVKLKASRKVEGITDYSAYGLEKPAITINVSSEDSTVQLLVGDSTPFSDGTYVMVNSSSKEVFIVSEDINAILEGIDYSTLVQLEEIPSIDSSAVTQLQVYSNEDTIIDYIKKEESISLYTGQNWYVNNTNEVLDDASVNSLISSVNNIVFSSFVTNDYSDFDALQTLKVYQGDSVVFELLIGEVEDSFYYCKLKDSSAIYTVSSSLLQSFLEPKELWDDDLFLMNASDIQKASIVTNDYTATIEDYEENEELLTTVSSILSSIYGTRKTDENGIGESFLTINIQNILNVSRTFNFYLYDNDNYLVQVTGDSNCYNCSYIVLASNVDKLIRVVHLATI